MTTRRAMPVIEVSDVARAAAFWERAGFSCHGLWGDPAEFAITQRGDVTLGLSRMDQSVPAPRNHGWCAYIYVDDIDALHAEFTAEGLSPSMIRRNEDYGCDDFDLRDPDGHLVAFGSDRDPSPGPGLSEDKGKG